MGPDIDNPHIAVLGLGYVGLPLAIELGTRYPTVGFDVDQERVNELNEAKDFTLEVAADNFADARFLTFTSQSDALSRCNTYIVTVPTPIDAANNPDLSMLQRVSETVGTHISSGDVVIFESTVYPGATEEVCTPIIEQVSGLRYNEEFFAGYSPERINPGDQSHRLRDIVKVTSGSTPETAQYVDDLYNSIIRAGTHPASSIAVAEAAKVIENTQRDVNIALVNELAIVFHRLGIDTTEVLEAAATKWNFMPFKPGLVGGHCIGVDPYYLTHKAQSVGYHPEVILAGRRINDGMGEYIAERVIKRMVQDKISPVDARVLVLGLAFKENCNDIRNSKVVDIIKNLASYNMQVDVFDPWVDTAEAQQHYGLSLIQEPAPHHYDAVVLAVGHQQFCTNEFNPLQYAKSDHVIFDVKGVLDRCVVTERL